MAVAEIIGAAIGVLLLVVVAYVLVGGTLTAAETVATAQKDLTLMQETRLRTSINIIETDKAVNGDNLNFKIVNNGNEIISDLPHMVVFSFNDTYGYTYYNYANVASAGSWSPVSFENDTIHAKEFDPGVKMSGVVTFSINDPKPDWIQVTTSNGVSASSAV
jgi:flagellar protein FlaF